MEREFWLERWEKDQLGWHLSDTNPLLARHWHELAITRGAAVFVPLCGKSLDMRYLESLGHPVMGIDFSEMAIRAYFEEAGEEARRTEQFYLTRFDGPRTTLYYGDFFDLQSPDILGIRAVYDRGALIALPEPARAKYADHMQRIIPEHAQMLLIALEYDQSRIAGPPHSVSASEIEALYSPRCRVTRLDRVDTDALPPRFVEAGIESASETVYHIVKEH
ncbi:MAG: thiopurine S-methyltransferase [Pseudomonadales bacterium]|jgi:thiopurine S-methyltransferase